MSAELPGGESFIQDYMYHLTPGIDKTLGAHMLAV